MANVVSIVGGGSWGTALAAVVARNCPNNKVFLAVRNSEIAKEINNCHTNRKYCGDLIIPNNVLATGNVLPEADIVILAVPAQHTRSACEQLRGLKQNTIVVITAKGIERTSLTLMSDVVSSILPQVSLVAISGPNLAHQVLEKVPSIISIGSKDRESALMVASLLQSETMLVELSEDIRGLQACGAVKNVLGIAFGMLTGLRCSENLRAKIFTQGIQEMRTACTMFGGNPNSVMLACGVGDLFLSCESISSRNASFGCALAQGKSVSTVNAPEGYYTAEALNAIAYKLSVDLPLCSQVYSILYEQTGCDSMVV